MQWLKAFVISCALNAALSADIPPNIILFLVDDMGWQDTSVSFGDMPTLQNEKFHTPAMEDLAKRGVVFTQAYSASPVCTPSRTAILTGQSPGRSKISYWILHPDQDTSASHPRLSPPPWNTKGLSKDDSTLPKILRQNGYRTIHVGKAHLGAVGTSGSDPINLGFDVNIAGHGAGAPGSYYGIHNFKSHNRKGKSGNSVWDVPGLEHHHGKDIYLTDALCFEAQRAIREAKEAKLPFFLQFAPYAVHTPIMANSKHIDSYTKLDQREAAYATMVESMDCALQSIIQSVNELGILDNTIVIFTSDNGGLSAHGRGGKPHIHNAPLRSGKGSAYEGGIRVPLIIAGKAVKHRGLRSDVPVISMDIFPTILELAHIDVSTLDHPKIDGVSIASYVNSDSEYLDSVLASRPLIWHMPHQWGVQGPGIEPFTAIRSGNWKLCLFHDGPRYELYDLNADVSESINRAENNPEVVSSLLQKLRVWQSETGAKMSRVKSTQEYVDIPQMN